MTQTTKKRAILLGGLLAIALVHPVNQAGGWLASRFASSVTETLRHQGEPATISFADSLIVKIDNKAVQAFGDDTCPDRNGSMVRTAPADKPDPGAHQCIVIEPTTKKVNVTLAARGEVLHKEEWTVDRTDDRIFFHRPNGSLVIALGS